MKCEIDSRPTNEERVRAIALRAIQVVDYKVSYQLTLTYEHNLMNIIEICSCIALQMRYRIS